MVEELAAAEPTSIVARYLAFLPKQTYPIRSGVHPNTAFGLAFALDYARAAKHKTLRELLEAAQPRRTTARTLDVPAAWEPDGADFFSPSLMEADLMRRVLPAAEFRAWLERFLPDLAKGEPKSLLNPATVSDRSDPQIVHLDGLNLSRAWCMRSIAAALPKDDAARKVLSERRGAPRRGGVQARGQRRLRGGTLVGVVRGVHAFDAVSSLHAPREDRAQPLLTMAFYGYFALRAASQRDFCHQKHAVNKCCALPHPKPRTPISRQSASDYRCRPLPKTDFRRTGHRRRACLAINLPRHIVDLADPAVARIAAHAGAQILRRREISLVDDDPRDETNFAFGSIFAV